MKKYFTFVFAAAVCPLFSQTSPQPDNYTLPAGNFGIDFVCAKVADAKAKIYDASGVELSFDYYADVFSNPLGGAEQGTQYTHIMEFSATADLQKIAGIKGASFTVSGAYNSGSDLSGRVGNFFTISESSVTTGWMFYEMYYTQQFDLPNDDAIVVKFGRMSMDDSFASLPVFGYLGGGAMDSVPEAIFSASPFTSSSIATWGIVVEYQTAENLAFSYGLFQTLQSQNSPDWDGFEFGIHRDDGYMMLAQVQWTPTFAGGLQGTYSVGGYFFGGYEMSYLSGAGSRSNGYGFYLQGQQNVWVDSDDSGKFVCLWAGVQYAPITSISTVQWQPYAGVQIQGVIPRRKNDAIFLSWTSGFFSGEYRGGNASCETVFEANYLWQVNEYLSVQPVMQYVLCPNGDSDIDDALIIGGQVLLSF